MSVVTVPGKKTRHIMLYALSTCGWCRKTRELLDELGVEYDYEYVDQLVGQDRERVIQVVTSWNPACSFPTLVIDEKTCITGFKEQEIKEMVAR
jgi:glutaredoxin